MKKMIAAMIILVLVSILVGCGHESMASSSAEATTTVTFPEEKEEFSEDVELDEVDVDYNKKQLTEIMFSELGIGKELYAIKTEFSADAKTCKVSGCTEEIRIERMIAKADFLAMHEVIFEKDPQIENKTEEKVFINCVSDNFTIEVDGEYTIIINPTF